MAEIALVACWNIVIQHKIIDIKLNCRFNKAKTAQLDILRRIQL